MLASTLVISPNKYVENDDNYNIVTLIIDSRDRDHSVQPDPNNYTIYFPETYRDVLNISSKLNLYSELVSDARATGSLLKNLFSVYFF